MTISPIRDDLKQGDDLSPLFFNIAVEHTIRTVQVSQDCLKLNCTHSFWFMPTMLIYWEEAYVL